MTMSKDKMLNNHSFNALPEKTAPHFCVFSSLSLRTGSALSGLMSRAKQFPVLSQKWSMEDINSTYPHCKREICKQSDPTSTETDSIPYGKYKKMFAGLIIGNSYYSCTKKRVLKKMKGSLVVCLS